MMPARPTYSGCASSIRSMLSQPVTTGTPSRSTASRNREKAPEMRMPLPALSTGRFASRSFRSTRSTASSVGSSSRTGGSNAHRSSVSTVALCTFSGISSQHGPGRPLVARYSAFSRQYRMRSGSVTISQYFVIACAALQISNS